MLLEYWGHSFFTVTTEKGTVVAFDPYGEFYDYPKRRIAANVCVVSHHHHDHDADEVFTSWGVETAKKFSKADIEHALTELDGGKYGMILRSKGIVDGGADGWLEFDYVPGEWEVRQRGADVGGKLVVIGSKLDEKAIAALFGC